MRNGAERDWLLDRTAAPCYTSSTDERSIRTELGEILDRLGALPPDSFAERGALLDRRAELRAALRAIAIAGAEDIEAPWSAQAARKRPEDDTPVVIESPIESGSSGGI